MSPHTSNHALGAVIVTYNSAEFVGRCLRSIENLAQVVVVDNASADRTCAIVEEASPNAILLRNETNRGFAAAVNQGVRTLSTPLLLVLNPDAELLAPLADDHPLIERARQPETGVVGGKLVDEDGTYQRGFAVRGFPSPWTLAAETLLLNRLWPGNPINRAYRRLDFDPDRAQPCEQPAGALLAFRREIFELSGGFDERFYPLWFEDADFCWSVRDAGFQNFYEPAAVARHYGAHSLKGLSLRKRQAAWYGSLLRFTEKRFSPRTAAWMRPVVALGLAARAVAGGGRDQRRSYWAALREVWTADLEHPPTGARPEGAPAP